MFIERTKVFGNTTAHLLRNLDAPFRFVKTMSAMAI